MSKYQQPRNVRRIMKSKIGRLRGGKLAPVMAVRVRPSEGGMLQQSITFELDPIAGRMSTQMFGELIAVFVPTQAIDAIKDPAAAYAGMTEVIREKLLSGSPLFVLENEGEISKRLGIQPISIGGVLKVNESARLAHNAAVNYLRLRKYHKAAQILHSNTALTPAIISDTVLDRLNGVLDPDDRINGAVQLELPTVSLPVDNLFAERNYGTQPIAEISAAGAIPVGVNASNVALRGRRVGVTDAIEPITALFSGVTAGSVSLTDFYNAQKQDELVRTMDQIIKDNPEFGEEMVLRWAHGLSVDAGHVPFVVAERRLPFGRQIVPAMDSAGVNADTMRSDMSLQMAFTIPIPRTELGGVIITFAVLKPDETLATMPDPDFTEAWGLDNFVADELALDPVPVTLRELDTNCGSGNEATVAFYTGLNARFQAYVNYGLSRQLDPTTVENKTEIWQLAIPLSVTPDNILYPASLDHFPFADNAAEVCTYNITSMARIVTPMIFGPTPIEDIDVITTETLFEG